MITCETIFWTFGCFYTMIQEPLSFPKDRDLLGPRLAVERSLEDSSWQHHVILGGVVVGVDSRGGHAPPAHTRVGAKKEPQREVDIKVSQQALITMWDCGAAADFSLGDTQRRTR